MAEPIWQDLFDGATLNGWTQKNGKAKYTVEDGMVVGTTVLGEPNSFLCTDTLYGDFILEYEFLVNPNMNSGAFTATRSKLTPRNAPGPPASTTRPGAAG